MIVCGVALVISLIIPFASIAQQLKTLNQGDIKKDKPVKQGSAWTLDLPIGFHDPATIDTLLYNYQRQAVPSLADDAYISTGNLGAPGQSAIYFNRPQSSPFFFADALSVYLPTIRGAKYYNVYQPMTLVSYNTGGNKQTTQDRLRAVFAANAGRRIGITATFDYLYSKGSYTAQSTKDLTFGFGGYYRGDRYEAQFFLNHFNMLNKENGGITDELYITDPAQLQGGVSKIEPLSIPVRLTGAHSRLAGTEVMLNQAYNVGFWRTVAVNDTLNREVYVPVTKFVWTFDYTGMTHLFNNTDTSQGNDFWAHRYLQTEGTRDRTTYASVANTVGLSMIEGFQKWAKFGLSAFATYEWRRYIQTPDTVSGLAHLPSGLERLPWGTDVPHTAIRHHLWVGGELSRSQGTVLTYNAKVRVGLAGDVAGDFEANGRVQTRFRMLGDTVLIAANGRFENRAPSYLLKNYISNHFAWTNDFGKTRSLRVGGELQIPWTRTGLKAEMENVQNLVYFGYGALPDQHSGNIQIFAASIDQKLHAGIWRWYNTVTYQVSSDQTVLPLPALTVYSNMFLDFTAFRVLHVQFGVDCDFFTRYRGVRYQPATMTFYTAGNQKIGAYPLMNLYATCKLYKVRFFVMMSHINQGWFGHDYFTMRDYPVNPRKFQFGLSVDFPN